MDIAQRASPSEVELSSVDTDVSWICNTIIANPFPQFSPVADGEGGTGKGRGGSGIFSR